MPRTPADIGHDIAAAMRTIAALKAELADVPPAVLVIESTVCKQPFEFCSYGHGYMRVSQGKSPVYYEYVHDAVGRLRAWLNHYYPAPEASS